jgi:hypothetical protein
VASEVQLPHSQKPNTCPYPKPDRPSPCPPPPFFFWKIHLFLFTFLFYLFFCLLLPYLPFCQHDFLLHFFFFFFFSSLPSFLLRIRRLQQIRIHFSRVISASVQKIRCRQYRSNYYITCRNVSQFRCHFRRGQECYFLFCVQTDSLPHTAPYVIDIGVSFCARTNNRVREAKSAPSSAEF